MMVAFGEAFSSPYAFLPLYSNARVSRNSNYAGKSTIAMAVTDVTNEESFDEIVKGANDSLVVIDYSTTWCGPCKVIAPKFDELSDKYPQAKFLKVRGRNPFGNDYDSFYIMTKKLPPLRLLFIMTRSPLS